MSKYDYDKLDIEDEELAEIEIIKIIEDCTGWNVGANIYGEDLHKMSKLILESVLVRFRPDLFIEEEVSSAVS